MFSKQRQNTYLEIVFPIKTTNYLRNSCISAHCCDANVKNYKTPIILLACPRAHKLDASVLNKLNKEILLN